MTEPDEAGSDEAGSEDVEFDGGTGWDVSSTTALDRDGIGNASIDGTDDAPEPELSLLDRLAEDIGWPDSDAEAAARVWLAGRAKPADALGRLEELAVWIAGTQGTCPPREPGRVRVVIFAAEHGIAEAGVSADPPRTTALRIAATNAGEAVSNILADVVGASVRLVDLGTGLDKGTGLDNGTGNRRVSGRIDRADALTPAETLAAVETGARIADEEIDSGADLLIVGDVGVGTTTVAAIIVAVMTNTEPVKVVGRGSGIDDDTWSRKVAAIRDGRRRGMPHRNDMIALLTTVGGADLAALTGFLLRAAARRTPVLLDGVVVGAAALVAREVSPRAIRWWQAAHRTTEPAHRLTLEQLPLEPLLDLRLAIGEGAGALLAVPLVRAAVRTLTDLGPAPTTAVPGSGADLDAPTDDRAEGSADVRLDERRFDQPGS